MNALLENRSIVAVHGGDSRLVMERHTSSCSRSLLLSHALLNLVAISHCDSSTKQAQQLKILAVEIFSSAEEISE